MSLLNKNSLAVLLGAMVISVAALQGCSSDEQATPAAGGKPGTAGSGGKSNTAGTAGKPVNNEGGAAGQDGGEGGSGAAESGEGGEGGEGGSGPVVPCDLSFDNNTLTALTDNGGVLPDLP